jgi:hypothetical protein
MVEPGLDQHEWESEWAALEEDLADAPFEALPDLHDLLERMLIERGVVDRSLVAAEGADPELVRPWQAGGELVRQIAGGEDVDPGDVAQAIENYRELFQTLLAERRPP